jgi:hypothetical protein
MAKRRSGEKSVPVSISLPEPVYNFLQYTSRQKGLTVSEHIREWILGSLQPWEDDVPLPLDAHSVEVVEMPDELAPDVPTFIVHPQAGPKREDFTTVEEYVKAERADRYERGLETRRRKHAEHIRKIAEARAQHPRMLLKSFAQLLFDQDIYKSNDNHYQQPSPVNTRLLSMWLREAADLGLLPKAALPQRTAALRRLRNPQTP